MMKSDSENGHLMDSFRYETEALRWPIKRIEKLIPWPVLNEIAGVLDRGSSKEGDGVLTRSRSRCYYLWKFIKHAFRGVIGYRYDNESGKSHFAHAVARFIQFWMTFKTNIREEK